MATAIYSSPSQLAPIVPRGHTSLCPLKKKLLGQKLVLHAGLKFPPFQHERDEKSEPRLRAALSLPLRSSSRVSRRPRKARGRFPEARSVAACRRPPREEGPRRALGSRDARPRRWKGRRNAAASPPSPRVDPSGRTPQAEDGGCGEGSCCFLAVSVNPSDRSRLFCVAVLVLILLRKYRLEQQNPGSSTPLKI